MILFFFIGRLLTKNVTGVTGSVIRPFTQKKRVLKPAFQPSYFLTFLLFCFGAPENNLESSHFLRFFHAPM